MNARKNHFKDIKFRYNQKGLLYTMTFFLFCLFLLLGGYGLFSYLTLKDNTAKNKG